MTSDVAQKINDFFASYRLQYFKKRHILIYAGNEPPGIFYLISGQVREYDISDSGDEIVVNIFKPPAFFPMSWAINKTPNQYFFETTSPVSLKQAPADEALAFLKTNLDVVFDLLSRLYSGTDGILRRMAHLMGGSAYSRVLFELIIECRRFGKRQLSGTYIIDLHERELADRMGLSRESVSREIAKIKKLGLIEVSRKGLLIKNLTKLDKELGGGL